MGPLDRHMGKMVLALILLSGPAALLFGYDLYRTVGIDTSPPPLVVTAESGSEVLELPKLKPKAQYDLIAKRNLFVFPEGALAKKAPSPPPEDTIKNQTALNVTLDGTIISPNGYAVAIIEDRVRRKEDIYVVGDRIQDAEIIEIEREQVILKRDGDREKLTMFTQDKRRRTRPGSSARTSPLRHQPPRRPSSVTRSASARSTRQIQQKIRLLMAQLRLRPHFERGKPAGFKVGRIAEGSVFQAAGLKQGDIVVGINDEDVRTPNQLLKAYRVVGEEEELWLNVLRDGEEEDFDIDVEWIMPE